ncbi:hypothetical protein E3P99_03187 [Wallemia hederae]|uniref:C3HC-type domain-containing protein n=1 Tax=Wallemia hederae TaxID=1540922 RepID=A0A4T0FIP9_9BASI|nr:hypothetical protein E3P99_03187 [Wallemia hederae]
MNKRKYEDALNTLDKTFQSTNAIKPAKSGTTRKSKMPDELERRVNWFSMTHKLQSRKRQSAKEISDTTTRSDLFGFEKFIERLQTFSLRTYTSKPAELSPPAVALKGWQHDNGHRNRIVCTKCKQGLIVDFSATQPSNTYSKQLTSAHAASCPWRYQYCPDSMYRIQELYLPPSLAANSVAERARRIDSIIPFHIQINHPLSGAQVDTLLRSLPEPRPSKESSILALYGWEHKPTALPSETLLVSQLDCAVVSLKSDKSVDVVRNHRFYAPQLTPSFQGSSTSGAEALYDKITRRGRKKQLEESFVLDSISRQAVVKNIRGLLLGHHS